MAKKLNVGETVLAARREIKNEDGLSPGLKATMEGVLDLVTVLANRLGLNSSNSSKPPSMDPNRARKTRTTKGKRRKPGGQKGHGGSRLEQVENPTVVEELLIDRRTLPTGKWMSAGFDKRQVFDIEVSFSVTEYQAEVLENELGETYVAEFPIGVTEPAQYGIGVKSTSVYLSQFQLIPQARVQDLLNTQYGLPLTKGSVNNFNILAARTLRDWDFRGWLRNQLLLSPVLHADETGTNINGDRYWIHCLCNETLTYFHVDPKRGQDAMERMGVLAKFGGLLVHDHWKPYFLYLCTHVLCNAHHLRELERAVEQDSQKWAKRMKALLEEINALVNDSGGKLSKKKIKQYQKLYRRILKAADKECPENKKQRAQSKSRNLLERLIAFEEETLRFMVDEQTPFTNNQGERDLRMNKVQQKISGCFRTERGAEDFCLIRSYLSICRKRGLYPMETLRALFSGAKPKFMKAK
ncbi:MAG: IS66 family transposase [Bdellovibrionales bacterium]|nr:IS66 family transposase [Bdellovibrionales bacterium]